VTSTDRDVQIRRATPGDAAALAAVHVASRNGAYPAMPASVHRDDEALAWVAGWLHGDDEVWVAEVDGTPVGYARLTPGWLDDLYVVPEHAGRGVGSTLLDLAKSVRPAGFALWVFESNVPARRFYARHGLVELERTDGSANEEKAPDVRMAWPGRDPMAYLRAQVDEVDDELAVLLARRAALTAAIQDFKDVPGHAGRDPEREAEIAARMARHAPGLGTLGLQRIMHEVITASLDAHARAATLRLDMLRLVDEFVARLPAGAHVLEVGIGSGQDASALEERGVRVDAAVLDPLHDELEGPYDGVYASAVLLHLSPEECAGVLRRLRDATRDGGVLAVTLEEGDRSVEEALVAAGWVVVRLDRVPPESLTGPPWLHVLATTA
jgi:chorismate mutase/GNAT superfamily N-acetyltransferase